MKQNGKDTHIGQRDRRHEKQRPGNLIRALGKDGREAKQHNIRHKEQSGDRCEPPPPARYAALHLQIRLSQKAVRRPLYSRVGQQTRYAHDEVALRRQAEIQKMREARNERGNGANSEKSEEKPPITVLHKGKYQHGGGKDTGENENLPDALRAEQQVQSHIDTRDWADGADEQEFRFLFRKAELTEHREQNQRVEDAPRRAQVPQQIAHGLSPPSSQ